MEICSLKNKHIDTIQYVVFDAPAKCPQTLLASQQLRVQTIKSAQIGSIASKCKCIA